jgi:hypothetical protein
MLLLGLGVLNACTVLPTGPYALVLPAVGKSMDVFQVEEGECRSYARRQLGVAPSKLPPQGGSRPSMTEPMSNICTPKGQCEDTSVGIEMLVDAAADFLAAFRELDSGLLDAQGDVDTLEAAMEDDDDGQQA